MMIFPQRMRFQSTCPLRGTTDEGEGLGVVHRISIHVPLAGHDTVVRLPQCLDHVISIHVPLAGHDGLCVGALVQSGISIHVPLAGHDLLHG